MGSPTLSTTLPGLSLTHPLMNASGILGSSRDHARRYREWGLAAMVTKTFTPQPREGYETPIIIALPTGGFLNAVGLANPGRDRLPEVVEAGRALGLPVIVSAGGMSPEDFREVAIVAEEYGASAVELNLSCPHTRGYGLEIGSDPAMVYKVVEAVASSVKIPVYAKLGLSDQLLKSAEKALEAGAKCLTLINTVKAMYIDVYTLKPVLSNIVGGLSGPPIHPIAVRVVYEAYRELKPCIIGVGGIQDWASAAELVAAGARALQVGSMLAVKGRELVEEVLRGLRAWLESHGFKSLEEAVGVAHRV